MDIFHFISPLDYRYYGRKHVLVDELGPYLSENAFLQYKLAVEAALVTVLAKRRICSQKIADEIHTACKKVTTQEVYEGEDKIKHDIRALANAIREKVSDEAKPFVHLTLTSYDIVNTAEALMYKKVACEKLIPTLLELEKLFIQIARREKATIQIGRTHGQHAEPITFGFTMAEYVSRLGTRIVKIKEAAENLRGKISGAVGSYNSSSLLIDDPEQFEKDILKELGLRPATHSTQIVEPEYVLDYIHAVIACFGVLANFADDMRHLQRTEISEIAEFFERKQVGSSTMPHKRNPINFENVKSMWKAFMPRIVTVYMDQLSEHQRDLTNSASSRFIPETILSLILAARRLHKVCEKLVVDKECMKRNFNMHKEMIIAEPLYILLAAHNHPNAHEYVRELTLKSQIQKKPLTQLIKEDSNLASYLKKCTKQQIALLEKPENYIGLAEKKTEEVCDFWEKEITKLAQHAR